MMNQQILDRLKPYKNNLQKILTDKSINLFDYDNTCGKCPISEVNFHIFSELVSNYYLECKNEYERFFALFGKKGNTCRQMLKYILDVIDANSAFVLNNE